MQGNLIKNADEGQDQESTRRNASELVVGNEESGQASPSSTTTVASDDNDATVNDELLSTANLPATDTDAHYNSDDIANISPSDHSTCSNEANNNVNGMTVYRPVEADTDDDGGGGGDWFGDDRHNPNNAPSFTTFLTQFIVAGAIAVILLIIGDIIEGLFKGPFARTRHKKHRHVKTRWK